MDMGLKAWFVESGGPEKGERKRETRDTCFSDMVNAPPLQALLSITESGLVFA